MPAREQSEKESNKGQDQKPPEKPQADNLVTTQHRTTIDGRSIAYSVTCGTMVLREEAEKKETPGESEGEKPKASIFFVAYTRDDCDNTSRPITFSFNGGPGSSSVWLHMGVLGPRLVQMDDMGNAPPPPYRLTENPYSLLDITDLVFIDPVSTGFSRVVPGEKAKDFHGFKKDIESVGDFIRLFTTRYQRWASPKFLIGESYGTTRASGLSGYLQDRHGLFLNGIMLISSILDFSTAEFETGNDLPYILYLPTYTATAWYHHKLSSDLQVSLAKAVKEAEQFALGEYALALMKGSQISPEEKAGIAQKLSRLTGLSVEYILRTDLRIQIFRFTKELLRKEGQTVGRLDTRFKGVDRDTAGEFFESDPSLNNIMGPYTALFNHYVRSELKFESDLPYEILNMKVWPWSYADHENKYVNVAETLRKAITSNPYLKVLVANGYFDLATPYFATEYTFNHLGLDEKLVKNIQMTFYEAGHMMYIHKPSIEKLKADLSAFILSSVPG